MPRDRILVVDDEADILELVRYNLARAGFEVECVASGEEAVRRASRDVPDLVVLDLMLPGMDGLDVCRRLKSSPRTAGVPIVMLTARGEDADVVTGLEMGADDYVVKPFSPRVLVARVRSVLRRRRAAGDAVDGEAISVGPLEMDPGRRRVLVGGRPVDLTASQFAILAMLARRPGWVFTRKQIIDAVRGEDYAVTDRSVDVQVAGLRRKLGEAGDLIETMRGVGYRLREDG